MVKQVDVTDGRTWNTTRTWTVSAGYPVGSRAVLIGGRYLVWPAGTPDPVTRLAYRAVTIPNVPRGTYYVRVRAVNELGASAASGDVRIDVP